PGPGEVSLDSQRANWSWNGSWAGPMAGPTHEVERGDDYRDVSGVPDGAGRLPGPPIGPVWVIIWSIRWAACCLADAAWSAGRRPAAASWSMWVFAAVLRAFATVAGSTLWAWATWASVLPGSSWRS